MTESRITTDPDVMGGMPCVRGLRMPVATLVGMIADGISTDEVLADFPYLVVEDIQAALHYAAAALRDRELPLRPSA